MIASYLFLPDNLMTILYEEQKLIQSLLDFPFKSPFPMFKTSESFSTLTVYPPIANAGFIIRPCGNSNNINEGFILGNARSEAENIIKQINKLKTKTKSPVFTKLHCKAWYYAKVELKEENTNLCVWSILGKNWVKEK